MIDSSGDAQQFSYQKKGWSRVMGSEGYAGGSLRLMFPLLSRTLRWLLMASILGPSHALSLLGSHPIVEGNLSLQVPANPQVVCQRMLQALYSRHVPTPFTDPELIAYFQQLRTLRRRDIYAGSIHVLEREVEDAATDASRPLKHLCAWLEAQSNSS